MTNPMGMNGLVMLCMQVYDDHAIPQWLSGVPIYESRRRLDRLYAITA